MAVAKRKISAEDLFRLRIPSDADLSPDGAQVVFALKTMDAKKNCYDSHLYQVSTRGHRLRQLTRGEGLDIGPRWSPDGRHIAFISTREDKIPQVWVLPTDGGEARPLTKLRGGLINDLHWSPDSRHILFGHRIQPKEDPEKKKLKPAYKHITRILHKLDGDGYFPTERWHIWKVSVPGGRAQQLTRGENDDGGAAWSPDGRRIAFVSNRIPEADYHAINSDIFVMNASGKRLRQVTKRFGPAGAPAWSADGKSLYYMGHFGKDGEWLRYPFHIYAIPAGGGRSRDLTPKLDQWPFNMVISDTARSMVGGFILPFRTAQSEERLAFAVNEHGACRLYSIPAGGGRPRIEFGGAVNVLDVSVTPGGARAATVAAQAMDCGDIYAFDLDGSDERRQLTHLNRATFGSLRLTEPEEMIFGSARNKNVPVHGWVLKPPGFRKDRRYPLVLNVHGGPMAQYGYTFFHEMHLLAAQGYVVVFVNPRGSSGYGLRFMNCIENRWGKLDYDDLMGVVDQMVRKRYVDRSRLGVLGGSYGGFMTTWIVGHTNRFKAAVTQRQLGNYMIQVAASDFGYYRIYGRGSAPWQTPMKYLKDSPNYYVDRMQTPLLIIHSENDLRCPISQADELFTFLKWQRKTVELIRFENEFHGLSRGGKPQNRRERLKRILDWFERYL
jgi:dipeptidyl aminopeptidase/acylaminoacyl peptidase